MINAEILDEMFDEMLERDGYDAWYESEEAWEDYELEMIARGVDEEIASEYFSNLAWEL